MSVVVSLYSHGLLNVQSGDERIDEDPYFQWQVFPMGVDSVDCSIIFEAVVR